MDNTIRASLAVALVFLVLIAGEHRACSLEVAGLSAESARSDHYSLFRWACRTGDLGFASQLDVLYGGSLERDARDVVVSAFRESMDNGHLAVARWIDDRFRITDAEARSSDGQRRDDTVEATPDYPALISACRTGSVAAAAWMAERFSLGSVELRTGRNSPLAAACYHGHVHMIEWLLERAGDLRFHNDSELHDDVVLTCAPGGHVDALTWLVDATNFTRNPAHCAPYGTALAKTCKAGHIAMARFMIERFQLGEGDLRPGLEYDSVFCSIFSDGDVDTVATFVKAFNVARSPSAGHMVESQALREHLTRRGHDGVLRILNDLHAEHRDHCVHGECSDSCSWIDATWCILTSTSVTRKFACALAESVMSEARLLNSIFL
jgi:hypothetical protein